MKTEDGARAVLERFHLIMALVVGLPLSDFEFTTLDPSDSAELLEAVAKILERRSHTPAHGSVEVDPARRGPRSA